MELAMKYSRLCKLFFTGIIVIIATISLFHEFILGILCLQLFEIYLKVLRIRKRDPKQIYKF